MKKYFLLLLWLCIGSKVHAASFQEDYNAGLRFYSSGDYLDAVVSFDDAVHLVPDNAAALIGRADTYYALGKFYLALSDYRAAQALQPQNTQLSESIKIVQVKIDALSLHPRLAAIPAGDHRMERRFGVYLGVLSDPMISLGGISVAYNVSDFLRLTGSCGTVGTGTVMDFGFGAKVLVPNLEFSPVIGLNLAQDSFDLTSIFRSLGDLSGNETSIYNLTLVYANIGFDCQQKNGFDVGFGFDLPLNLNGAFLAIPGVNMGWFF